MGFLSPLRLLICPVLLYDKRRETKEKEGQFMELLKDFRDNDSLRASFNALAKETFGLNFEDWYQNGYWTDRYNPHSVVVDGQVVSNVSVNQTYFEVEGKVLRFLQLGTVMTKPEYRKQGLAKKLMEWIFDLYEDQVDGIYLFGNDFAYDFYRKMGFEPAKQYGYSFAMEGQEERQCDSGKDKVQQVPMADKAAWDMLENNIKVGTHGCAFDMVDNSQLVMFYVTKFMQGNVYYHSKLNSYVIAEADGEDLSISMVISPKGEEADLRKLAGAFGPEIKRVTLGFSPKSVEGMDVKEICEEDCTFFIRGDKLKMVEEKKLMVPELAHA